MPSDGQAFQKLVSAVQPSQASFNLALLSSAYCMFCRFHNKRSVNDVILFVLFFLQWIVSTSCHPETRDGEMQPSACFQIDKLIFDGHTNTSTNCNPLTSDLYEFPQKSTLLWCNKRVKKEQRVQFIARTPTYSSLKRNNDTQTKAKISHVHCLGTTILFNGKLLRFATRPDKWAKHLRKGRIQFVHLK